MRLLPREPVATQLLINYPPSAFLEMRSVLRLVFLIAIVFSFHLVRGQSGDPSQMFLNAYMAVQQGEKLEKNGKKSEALSKLRYAASLLDQISSRHSDWQPLIIQYRKKKTREMIRRLEDTVALKDPEHAGTLEPILEGPDPLRNAPPPAAGVDIDSSSSENMDRLETVAQRVRDRMRQLEIEVSKQRKQIDSLQREKQELSTRLSDSMQQVDKARTKEAELRAQLVQTRTALDNARSDAVAGSELRTALQERALMLTEALQQARDESAVADEFAGDLQNQMRRVQKAAEENIAAISSERDEAITTRDAALAARDSALVSRDEALASLTEALASLEKSKTAQEQAETLKNENEALLARLEKAEHVVKNFHSELPRKDEEIVELRQEVATAKEMLAEAQEKSREYQSSIVDLREQLEANKKNLAELKESGTQTPGEMSELQKENELLRSIVERELKEQARRGQARKLVVAELTNLEGKSEALMNLIEYLGQPLVKLTDKERALLRESQIDLPEIEESGAMEISIAAPKPQTETAPATSNTKTASFDSSDVPFGSEPSTESDSNLSPQVETEHSPSVPAELLAQAKQARELFDRSDYREAEKIYEKMQAEAPNNLYILSNLGVVRFRSGKLRQAEEAFQKALAIDPNDSFSRCTLGIVFYQQGKYDNAIDELTQALALDPKNATAHNYLGITASQKGWPEAAQKEMETAIQLDPNYADAYFNLAVIHATWQPPDRVEAKRYYQKALSLGAQPDPALENLLE